MYEQIFSAIENGENVRQQLIGLRKEIKTAIDSGAARIFTDGQQQLLTGLLKAEDAKTRKNAVLILGEAACTASADAIYAAYLQEKTLFVRASYLTALKNMDYRPYKEGLKQRLDDLTAMAILPEEKKHYDEERRLLEEMVMSLEKPEKHRFTGWKLTNDILCVTSPGMEQLFFELLPEKTRQTARILNGGVHIQTDQLRKVAQIRIFKQLLFRFSTAKAAAGDWQGAADSLLGAGLVSFLEERHEGSQPFCFRIDLRTQMSAEDKAKFIRRLAGALETGSDHRLINSPSYYEFEIRVIEDKKQQLHFYVRLATMPDLRFAYRKHALPTSMHPVRAAEIALLAKPYLEENASVLDPMCGVGTLLIERAKLLPVRHLYGIDIYGEAIRFARENTAAAKLEAYYIQRDLRDYKSNFLFDEVMTQLPGTSAKGRDQEQLMLFDALIRRLPELLAEGKRLIIFTDKPGDFKRLAEKAGYLQEEADFSLSGNRKDHLLVFKLAYLL